MPTFNLNYGSRNPGTILGAGLSYLSFIYSLQYGLIQATIFLIYCLSAIEKVGGRALAMGISSKLLERT